MAKKPNKKINSYKPNKKNKPKADPFEYRELAGPRIVLWNIAGNPWDTLHEADATTLHPKKLTHYMGNHNCKIDEKKMGDNTQFVIQEYLPRTL